MRRREFITLLGGAAAWPRAAEAQQPKPVLGILSSASVQNWGAQFAALHRALAETGYVEGRNLVVEYRWANDQYDRLAGLAADLVDRRVAVLLAAGGPISALAAKKATSTIPVVFTAVADPVKSGLVASLNRPGGNVTGTAGLTSELDPKRLELLHQLVPGAGTIGVLVNPNRPEGTTQVRDVQAAAQTLGRPVVILPTATEREIDTAFETLARERVVALLLSADPFFNSQRTQLVALAARHAIPTIYQLREFAAAGGLMSYGASIAEAYYTAGLYTGRILKGENPADLPVQQPTKFDLVINLRTARALGLDVPATLLARADEVIE